jgi:DNA mismatch repair protein MSH6
VNYAESDEDEVEDEDDVLGPIANNSRSRATKRRRVTVEDDSDDEFGLDAATQQAMLEDGTHSTRGIYTRSVQPEANKK